MPLQNSQIYTFDEFQIDAANRQLLRDGKTLFLSARAFNLLLALVENNNRLVGKDELFSRVWNDQIVEESNLTVHISQIRKVLGEKSRSPRYIETVPGFGYRFVADVKNAGEAEPIENQNFSEVEVKNGENDAPDLGKSAPSVFPESEKRNVQPVKIISLENKTQKKRFVKYALMIVAALGCGFVLAFGGYQYFSEKKSQLPFQKIKFTRLTNNGRTINVTISPDGKYIAYVLSEKEGNSLWIQQVRTAGNIRIVPPVQAKFWGLTFTPDGGYLYYSLFASDKSDLELFRIPSLGGASEKIQDVSANYISFSPDGSRFAYVQSDSVNGYNYLVTADANGENKKILAKRSHPNTFDAQMPLIAWSPDGEIIASAVNHFEADASYSSIIGINIKDGSEIILSKERWYNLYNIEWLKNGSGLLFLASEKLSDVNQVRFLAYPKGEAAQITNDLNQYEGLQTTADGKSFVTIQSNTNSSIIVGEKDTKDFKEIISETGVLQPFVWTPDEKIIFRSTADGGANLWKMDADGGNRRQLTTNAQVDANGLCISPGGKYVVFTSWRSGKINLWQTNSDGENLTQITKGDADIHPRCAPDGQTVVYQKGLFTSPAIWKVSITGNEAAKLTEFSAKWASISNDGKRIAYFYMTDDKWRIGIISAAGGKMEQSLDVPSDFTESVIHWSPDDKSLFYISEIGNVGNIRLLPLDGSPSKALTDFKTHLIDNFSWSPDGKKLAVSRNANLRDVILVENAE